LNDRNFLIVGTGHAAGAVAQAMSEGRQAGLRVIGHLAYGQEESAPAAALPLLGSLTDFPDVMQTRIVDGVIFTSSGRGFGQAQPALQHCSELGVPAYFYVQSLAGVDAPLRMEQVAGVPLLTPVRPQCGAPGMLKRVLDVLLAAGLLLLFFPLLAAAALLIKLSSAGPVIYRQARVGQNGRAFMLYKLRTMVDGAEHVRAQLAAHNEMDGPVFKMCADPRCTRVGRILRRLSLDEFPQLWNVLKGEMSIVGPRPPLPEEVKQYQPWQRRRLSVKPGLTCLWQVSGRNRIQFADWVRLDLEYIDHWSWWLEIKILFRTLPAMLKGQ
jgi:exopolysaccharide biosynthesis polyprenyl glycosylphosphotransferase